MLENRATVAARLEHKWLHGHVVPEKVNSIYCDPMAFRAQIVPGGEWIVVLCQNGALHLRKPGSDILCAVDGSFAEIVAEVGANDGMSLGVSVSDSGKIFLSLTIFGFWDTMFSTVFTMYRVHTEDPSFCLVLPPTRRVHEKYEGSPVVTGDLWAFSWWKGSRRLLAIGNVASDPNDRQEVVMDVGAFKFQATITLLPSRNEVMLSSRAGMILFKIPALQPSSGKHKILRARPVWMHNFESLDEYRHPSVSRLDTGLNSRIAILSGYHLRVLYLPEVSQHSDECRVTSHSLQTHDPPRAHARNCLSSQRVFYCKDDMLYTCLVPEAGDDGMHESHPLRSTAIVLDEARVGGRLRVHDIDWDEASGCLCLLVGQHHDYEGSRRSPLRIVTVGF